MNLSIKKEIKEETNWMKRRKKLRKKKKIRSWKNGRCKRKENIEKNECAKEKK